MADDEQFSLCWNNFNTNLSAGFHESLCRGDLVDVTLAAEGQFVKAHRLVLSVCSPYFRKMFTSMPANQHAFVFLKDVSHSALKDLIQFMYCGEVNVKQDALPAFISTAEALQIKGLTDSDPAPPPPVQSPSKPPTPAPQQIPSVQTSPRVKQQRISTSRSYKIETIEDSGDDNKHTQIVLQTTTAPQHIQVQTQPQQHQALIHQQQQTTAPSQKRPAQRSVSTPQTKRIKNNVDPLEAVEPNQINVQTVSESKSTTSEHQEIIEFPIDIPTKSEPDYTEDATEVEEGVEQETTYVEEDSYGDMKYDESYFTENDDANQTTGAGATTSGSKQQNTFSDSYVDGADQSATEAQDENPLIKREPIEGGSISITKKPLPRKQQTNLKSNADNMAKLKVKSNLIKSQQNTSTEGCYIPNNDRNKSEGFSELKAIPLSKCANFTLPENTIKRSPNKHALILIKKARLKGICVECLKRNNASSGVKKILPKICTFCPNCGFWICEPCFDILHSVDKTEK